MIEPWQQAERNLLGAVLLDPALFWQVADRVAHDDFAGAKNRRIWSGIAELAKAGPWDAMLLADHLNLLADVAVLKENAPGTASLLAYADRVVRYAEHRRVMDAADQIAKLSVDKTDDALPILVQAQKPKGANVRHISAVMVEWQKKLTERYESKSELSGISTGFQSLDEFTGGLQPCDLIILAARPSMGKTAFAMNIADNVASHGKHCAVFSMEMSAEQLVNRMVAARANVSIEALMQPKTIADEAWPRVSSSSCAINELPMHFDETSAISGTKLIARARQLHAQYELGLIVIDYLQLMQMRDPDNRTVSITEISGSLKQMAKELKVPVVVLSQLNRGVEQRADKRPMNSDLRDCGAIEQDADLIMFLYRDEYYNENSSQKGYAELLIRKQRNGRTGMIPLKTELQFCRFAHADYLPSDPAPDNQPPRFAKRFGNKGKS
jgi:replicative DNA helicase